MAMMMDIFGGLLSGAAFAGGVNDQYKVLDRPQGVGHWFMVFRPEVFLDSQEEYLHRMDLLLNRVRTSEPAAGVEKIYTPGETEQLKEEEQRAKGIPFSQSEVEALHMLAKDWQCDARLID